MVHENIVYYNPMEEDADFEINIEKIWKTFWNRKTLIVKIFCFVLAFFILLTFILPKKYRVSADLYINKTNSSNMTEVNPYVLDEASGAVVSMGTDKAINNEIELMKSSLVLDKVIRDNNIVYKKFWGIIPNKKEGEFLTAKAFYGKGKKLKLENLKNTNIISITYTAKNPDFAYGVVSSLINNYVEFHKDLNSEKSKSDKKLLESEYVNAKESLNKKLNQSSGLPSQSMTGIGNLTALSAFSRSASSAMGNIKGQYLAEEKSQIAINEEKQKVAQLASKLEWAKMVEQMSDSSKVLVINEPQKLRPFENTSPKLLINIILGCIFGILSSLIAVIYSEITSKKLSYSMLTNNILYSNDIRIRTKIRGHNSKKIVVVSFVQIPNEITSILQNISNVIVIRYDITDDFYDVLSAADKVVLIGEIDVTDATSYKLLREIIKDQQKDIICDILM